MFLHLIRHAKTNQVSPTSKDYDRELLERGWRQCQELDELFSKMSFSNAEVVCSDSKRTRQTLEGIKNNFKQENIEFTDELYLCSVKDYLKIIWTQKGKHDLVLIGHNFGISDLANYFLDTYLEMGTSEYICLEFPFESWEMAFKSTGILKNRFRPKAR